MAYDIMLHWFRHHDEACGRPRYVDHMWAVTLLTIGTALVTLKHPYHIFSAVWMSIFMISPMIWWFKV
jgi:hypothetical protein